MGFAQQRSHSVALTCVRGATLKMLCTVIQLDTSRWSIKHVIADENEDGLKAGGHRVLLAADVELTRTARVVFDHVNDSASDWTLG